MSALQMTYERCPFLAEVAMTAREPRLDPWPSALCRPGAGTDSRPAAMVRFYQRTGGLASSDEVMFLLRRNMSQPLSVLARWIVDQRVVSFEWQGQRLLPMFQFDRTDMSIRGSVTAVLAELSGTLEDWELAVWFAEPSRWLQGRTPLDALGVDPDAVVDAARADRFVRA